MEVEVLVLCDNAQLYNGGKMTVMGPFNAISANKCPAIAPTFSLACRLCFLKEDLLGEKTIKLSFLDPNGEEWLKPSESKTNIPDDFDFCYTMNFVLTFTNIKFNKFGKHIVRFELGNEFSRDLPIIIRETK